MIYTQLAFTNYKQINRTPYHIQEYLAYIIEHFSH